MFIKKSCCNDVLIEPLSDLPFVWEAASCSPCSLPPGSLYAWLPPRESSDGGT